mmetsp:Transcript_26647/g.49053  ORF Transcript_26647/g.49053 Transcript_26647/m.49053 type:complete len:594 (+) Transcript_26647:75-1856(+)
MCKISLVLACLSCAVHGWRVPLLHSTDSNHSLSSFAEVSARQEDATGTSRSLKSLALLLAAASRASAFGFSGHPIPVGARMVSRPGRSSIQHHNVAMSIDDDLKDLAREKEHCKDLKGKQGSENLLAKCLSSFMLTLLLGASPLSAGTAMAEPPAIAQSANTRLQTTALTQSASGTSQLFPTTEVVAAAESSTAAPAASRSYVFLTGFPFPLGPFFERKTVQTELVKDRVYSFEQQIKLSGVTANVRSTVFRMRDNHLLVYNPVAPTEEFLKQLKSLNHAGVSHIMLGATQYEHKVFVGPFARRFPEAKVWAVPDQWSFPLNLPEEDFGIFARESGGGDLVNTAEGSASAYSKAPDLTAEFEVKLLRPEKRLAFGYAANEAALFHKDTKTLALTDALVNIAAKPTPIYDERDMLDIGDNSRDSNSLGNIILKATGATNWQGTGAQDIKNFYADANMQGSTSEQVQRGWERNALLSLFFGPKPSTLVDPDPSFQKLKGHWIVAPVTNTLIYASDSVKPDLRRWIDDITKWDFKYISPSHFQAGPGTPDDVKEAFAPTLASSDTRSSGKADRPYDSGDVKLLDDISSGLKTLKVI